MMLDVIHTPLPPRIPRPDLTMPDIAEVRPTNGAFWDMLKHKWASRREPGSTVSFVSEAEGGDGDESRESYRMRADLSAATPHSFCHPSDADGDAPASDDPWVSHQGGVKCSVRDSRQLGDIGEVRRHPSVATHS